MAHVQIPKTQKKAPPSTETWSPSHDSLPSADTYILQNLLLRPTFLCAELNQTLRFDKVGF